MNGSIERMNLPRNAENRKRRCLIRKQFDKFLMYIRHSGAFHSVKEVDTLNFVFVFALLKLSLTVKVASRLQSLVADGKLNPEEAWNQCAVHLVKAATVGGDHMLNTHASFKWGHSVPLSQCNLPTTLPFFRSNIL